MFITWQTLECLKITVNSVVELVKFLINNNVSYVLTERFCKDPLENYLSLGRRKDNPSLFDFGFNDNTIRNQHIFHPIVGNCLNVNESNKVPRRVQHVYHTENEPTLKNLLIRKVDFSSDSITNSLMSPCTAENK